MIQDKDMISKNGKKLAHYMMEKYLNKGIIIPSRFLDRKAHYTIKIMEEIYNDREFWEKHPRDY